MSKYGDLNFDKQWYDEPLQKYLDHKRNVDDVTETRFNEIRNAVVESPDESEWNAWDEFVDWREEMTLADARAFKHQLEDADGIESSRTVKNKLRVVQSFLKELLEREVVDSNPVAYVLDETDFDHEEPDKIDRTVDKIGEYLQSIPNLQQRAVGVTFAKTGIRHGENYNIDLPYLHLDHDIYDRVLDQHDVTLVDKVEDHPDTLYIPSEPTTGEEFRGEVRQCGNKRKRGTRIPIDSELKTALLDWLAVRPETADPHPLWVRSGGQPTRIGKTYLNMKLTNYWAEETGLVNDGDTGAFTPHWFRYFFTTNMLPGRGYHKEHLNKTMVEYLRGDVLAEDMLDHYSQDWGNAIRKPYLNSIYQFGIYD